jgi:alpha-tubulin suppressor-like RCC1 family protein
MVTPCSTTPAPVRGGIVFRHIDVGHQYACGVDAAEHLYCWGIEAQERLGNGAGGSREITAPERVHNEFTMVSAGNDHACGVFAGNQGFCWGSGEYGAPGNGAAGAPQSRPGPVAGGLSFRSMQAGSRHSCGLTVTDDLYCWGYGRGGALGDETGSDSSVPVRVRAPS